MKHRITYIRDASTPFDPRKQLDVSKNSLLISSLQAAKEHRLTVDFAQLPTELSDVLRSLQELHLRWGSPKEVIGPVPFVSRLSPGLHIFLNRLKDAETGKSFCGTLQTIFGQELKCSSIEDTFSYASNESPSSPSTLSGQYHSRLPSIAQFALYVQRALCPPTDYTCQESAISILHADYLDIDYDYQSETITVSVFWNKEPSGQGWTEKIEKKNKDTRMEIGVLQEDREVVGMEQDEFGLGGWLTVIGEDERPKPTQFASISRHHNNLSPRFATSFDRPTGLHPTLRLSISKPHDHNIPDGSDCKLYTYLTLPSYLFLDRHAFSDPLFLQSHNLASLQSLTGATDLELPDYKIAQWGSAALFQLAPPNTSTASKSNDQSIFDVTIPLHLRYLSPTPGGYTNVTMPWPVVFWACPTSHTESELASNPFDRKHLGYDQLFHEPTSFWHVLPFPVASADRSDVATTPVRALEETITVPVLDLDKSGFVESATVALSVGGFLWVLWQLLRPIGKGRNVNVGSSASKTAGIGSKKNR